MLRDKGLRWGRRRDCPSVSEPVGKTDDWMADDRRSVPADDLLDRKIPVQYS